jgi:hypothetical protein
MLSACLRDRGVAWQASRAPGLRTAGTLFEFLDVWRVEEKALDHKPKVIIFDACPTWATASTFSSKVAARYECKVVIAAGGDHNKLPKMEAAQDPLTRMAEAMLKRRGWGKGFFLHARAYAVQVRNHKVANHQTHTRIRCMVSSCRGACT